MKNEKPKSTPAKVLLGFFALLLVGYHAGGFFSSSIRPRLGWRSSQLSVRWLNGGEPRTVATLDTVVSKHFEDAGSKFLGHAGYLARYYLESLSKGYFIRQGHVYLRDEVLFNYRESWARVRDEFLPGLRAATQTLAGSKAKILLVVVPPKISIEKTMSRPLAQSDLYAPLVGGVEDPRSTYEHLLAAVGDSVIPVDLLAEYEANSDQPLFPAHDQHWSSRGTAIAARAVINRLRAGGEPWPEPKLHYRKLNDPSRTERFRPPHFSFIPEWFAVREMRKQDREPLYDLESIAASVRPRGRIILWGTSFSDRQDGTGFSFGEVLAKALGRPLVKFAFPGGGAHGGLEAFGKSDFRLTESDWVIWEFPLAQTLGHFNQSRRLPELAARALVPRSNVRGRLSAQN